MNGTKVLLDTNIVLYILNGDEQIADLIQDCEAYVSVIARVELFSGPRLSTQDKESIQSFLDDCKLVQFTHEIQDLTIDFRQRFNLKLPDAAIAATASYLGVQLITADRSFAKLKNELSVTIIER